METRLEPGLLKCREKTYRGNVYLSQKKASEAAAQMSQATGARIVEFRCKFCHYYHLGTSRTLQERQERNR
jgi:cytochrome c5